MESRKLFELVESMRISQKRYFKTRTTSSLMESKELERRVDQELVKALRPPPGLFDKKDEPTGNLLRFQPVFDEMKRQVEKWGDQNHNPHVWNTIMVEEVGEVSQAILKTEFEGNTKTWREVIEELTQVQAVAQSMIESIKRNQIES